MKYLLFSLDKSEYAVDVSCIQSVIEYEGAASLPSQVSCLRGIVDVRGRLVPLYDLRIKLGITAKEPDIESRVIIVEAQKNDEIGLVGALVDGVSGVFELPEEDEMPMTGAAELFAEGELIGFSRVEERIIAKLSPTALTSGFAR